MADAQEQDGGEVFAPSLFSSAKEYASESGLSSTGEPSLETTKLEPQDIQWIPEAIADLVAWKMGAREVRLTPSESEQLGRLWVKPVQRLCAKIKDLDLIIAVGATGTMIIGKAIAYASEHPKQRDNSAGDTGKRENELPKRETDAGISLIRN